MIKLQFVIFCVERIKSGPPEEDSNVHVLWHLPLLVLCRELVSLWLFVSSVICSKIFSCHIQCLLLDLHLSAWQVVQAGYYCSTFASWAWAFKVWLCSSVRYSRVQKYFLTSWQRIRFSCSDPLMAPGPNVSWKYCRLWHYIDCLCVCVLYHMLFCFL